MGRPWRELEAEGVKRCCGVLYNRRTKKSRQCRRRAVDGSSWCEQHRGVMDYWQEFSRQAVEAERAAPNPGDESDDDLDDDPMYRIQGN